MQVTIGSLFSGIGGLELGLERAGLGPVLWQCELDPFCRRVLAKHWPDTKRYEDVKDVDERADRVDLICGGFPCQDLSYAGSGAGLAGARSGLWFEYLRIVRALRPRVVVVENVPALLTRGLGVVLGGLAESGYDARWCCVRASDVGAPHRRERVFIMAHADSGGREAERGGGLLDRKRTPRGDDARRRDVSQVGHASGARRLGAGESRAGWQESRPVPREGGAGVAWPPGPDDVHAWRRLPVASQPAICRVAHGVPRGVDAARLKALGNAVVPQVAEVIGRAIVEAMCAS